MDYKDTFIYILLATNLITGIVFMGSQYQGSQCMANPFKYGAESLSEDTGSNLSCSCWYDSPEYEGFGIDREGLVPSLLEDLELDHYNKSLLP